MSVNSEWLKVQQFFGAFSQEVTKISLEIRKEIEFSLKGYCNEGRLSDWLMQYFDSLKFFYFVCFYLF